MPQVDALVRDSAERFKGLGASVDTVSIPMHLRGAAIWLPVAAEGATMQMMLGNGFGFNWQGLYVTSMLDFHSAWRSRADELSDSLKNTMLLGHYMVTRYRGHYYAKAQNLVRRLRRAYDEALSRYDLLLMPTLPMVATPLPEANAPVAQILQRAFEMLANTAQFDCTHHPAMSVPCGLVDGLPVGMMLVAKAFDEETIYRAAAAFERASTGSRSEVNEGGRRSLARVDPGDEMSTEGLTADIEFSWRPFTLSGNHLSFDQHAVTRLEKPRRSCWGPAVYKWQGLLKAGPRAGKIGVLIGETGDLRQRIKQYVSGTQERGNRLWREE